MTPQSVSRDMLQLGGLMMDYLMVTSSKIYYIPGALDYKKA